jgi:hypothetical protein
MTSAPASDSTLATLRRILLGTLVVGLLGMGAELLFIGHVEGVLQWIPLSLLTAGVVLLAWFGVAPGYLAGRLLQTTMVLFVLSGGLGVWLHGRGNMEFELEMYPDRSGMELVRKTLSGATPVLAPGSMALLGLVGLALTYHHPAIDRTWPVQEQKETSS